MPGSKGHATRWSDPHRETRAQGTSRADDQSFRRRARDSTQSEEMLARISSIALPHCQRHRVGRTCRRDSRAESQQFQARFFASCATRPHISRTPALRLILAVIAASFSASNETGPAPFTCRCTQRFCTARRIVRREKNARALGQAHQSFCVPDLRTVADF